MSSGLRNRSYNRSRLVRKLIVRTAQLNIKTQPGSLRIKRVGLESQSTSTGSYRLGTRLESTHHWKWNSGTIELFLRLVYHCSHDVFGSIQYPYKEAVIDSYIGDRMLSGQAR